MKKILLVLLCIPSFIFAQFCGQSGQTTIIDNQTELDNIVGCTDFNGDYNRTVDLSQYPNAIYILQLNTKDGMLDKKLVLEK